MAKKYWLYRYPQGSVQAVERLLRLCKRGFMAIDLGGINLAYRERLYKSGVEAKLEQFKKDAFKAFFCQYNRDAPERRGYLYNALSMKPGDVIVVPLLDNRLLIADIKTKPVCPIPPDPDPDIEELDPDIDEFKDEFEELEDDDFSNIEQDINTLPRQKLASNTADADNNNYPEWDPIYEYDYIVEICNQTILLSTELAEKALRTKLKYNLGSTCDITELGASVEKTRASALSQPGNLYETASLCVDQVRKTLDTCTDAEFFKLVAWYMKKIGADAIEALPARSTWHEPKKGEESDFELLALFDKLHTCIVVYAKRGHRKQGRWLKTSFNRHSWTSMLDMSDCQDMVYIPWAISNCEAYELSYGDRYIWGIPRYIDGKQFAKLLLEVGFTSLDELRKE